MNFVTLESMNASHSQAGLGAERFGTHMASFLLPPYGSPLSNVRPLSRRIVSVFIQNYDYRYHHEPQ